MERLALALHRRGNRCALWIPGPRAPGCGFPGFGSLERSILRSAEHELGRAFGQLGCCTWGFSLRRAYRVTLRKGMAIHAMTQASAPMIRASGQ